MSKKDTSKTSEPKFENIDNFIKSESLPPMHGIYTSHACRKS